MYKRSQPMMNRDVHDYERTKSSHNKSSHDETKKELEYFLSNPKTISILRKRNIKEFYPIQAQTFKPIYQGQDVIARDRTGSGKTIAFTLPVIERLREQKKFNHHAPKFLIILPTRELVIQVHNEIQSLKFKDQEDFEVYCVYGKTSVEDNIRRLSRGVDILVGAPGRLNDLISRGAVNLEEIEVLCLDEADEILKQGFKQEIEKVFSEIHKVNKNKVQILLFSATIPQWLKELSEQYQEKDAPYINMIKDDEIRTSKTIKHYAVQISRMGEYEVVALIEEMVDKYGGCEKRILIFCERKAQVNNLSKNLKIRNEALHGDIVQTRRQNAYRNFKTGTLRCIVATNVAARGLDFPSVDLVIQMCPPLNTQDYIHRAGRTGRAGKEGICMTFFDRSRIRVIQKIQNEANISIEKISVNTSRNSEQRNGYDNNDRSNDGYGRNFYRDRDTGGDRNFRDNYGSRDTRRNDRYQDRNDRGSYGGSRGNGDRERSYNKGGYESNNQRVDPRMKYAQRNDTGSSPNDRNCEEKRSSPCSSRSNSRSKSKSPERKGCSSSSNDRKPSNGYAQEREISSKSSYRDDDY